MALECNDMPCRHRGANPFIRCHSSWLDGMPESRHYWASERDGEADRRTRSPGELGAALTPRPLQECWESCRKASGKTVVVRDWAGTSQHGERPKVGSSR
jgi:hypothetical protein